MRRFILGAALVCCTGLVQAQDIFSAEELDRLGKELSGRVQPNNLAIMPNVINEEGYFAHYLFREAGPGFAELHDGSPDLYFVTEGTATLITGGNMLDRVENSPGEYRGSSIEGGTSRRISKGDIVHIPAGIPHHVLVGEGEEITYFLFKPRS